MPFQPRETNASCASQGLLSPVHSDSHTWGIKPNHYLWHRARQTILGPVWSQNCVYTARHSVFSFLSLLLDKRNGLKAQIKQARGPHEIFTHNLTRQKYNTLVFYWPHICTYCSRPTLPMSPLTESVHFHSGREASASWSLLAFGGCVEDHSFSRATRLNKKPKFRLLFLLWCLYGPSCDFPCH